MFSSLSNLIPGVSTAKSIAAAGGGLALGVGITSIINKVESSKKNRTKYYKIDLGMLI